MSPVRHVHAPCAPRASSDTRGPRTLVERSRSGERTRSPLRRGAVSSPRARHAHRPVSRSRADDRAARDQVRGRPRTTNASPRPHQLGNDAKRPPSSEDPHPMIHGFISTGRAARRQRGIATGLREPLGSSCSPPRPHQHDGAVRPASDQDCGTRFAVVDQANVLDRREPLGKVGLRSHTYLAPQAVWRRDAPYCQQLGICGRLRSLGSRRRCHP